jgi:hypothetical protein
VWKLWQKVFDDGADDRGLIEQRDDNPSTTHYASIA